VSVYLDYWEECISEAAEECGLSMTPEQLRAVADAVMAAHDCYGMAFYSPPSSDRIHAVEQEWQQKCDALECEQATYRHNAETAVKMALRQSSDSLISIGEYGEVLLHGGRTEQIQ